MRCPYCASDTGSDALFCPNCGKKLEKLPSGGKWASGTVAAVASSGGKFRRRRLGGRLRIGLLCLIPVLAAAIALALLLPGRSREAAGRWTLLEEPGGGNIRILQAGRPVDTMEAGTLAAAAFSADGAVGCLHTAGGELHLLRDGEMTLLTDQVFSFYLSADGSRLACIRENLALMLYDTATGESRRIGRDVYGAVLSPKGESLAYYTLDSGGTVTAWLWEGKESRELSRNRIPFALSDGGERIWCVNDEKLYVLDAAGESARLTGDLDTGAGFWLSGDHRQLIYSDGGVWTLSGPDDQSVVIGRGSRLAPAEDVLSRLGCGYPTGTLTGGALTDRYYSGGATLLRLEKDGSVRILSRELAQESLRLCAGGSKAFWLTEGGALMTGETGKDPRQLVGNVASFGVCSRGKELYFLDLQGSLWYQKLPGTPALLTEQARDLTVTGDGCALFFSGEGDTLWVSAGGNPPEKALNHGSSVEETPEAAYVFCAAEEGYTLYAALEKGEFHPLPEK